MLHVQAPVRTACRICKQLSLESSMGFRQGVGHKTSFTDFLLFVRLCQ